MKIKCIHVYVCDVYPPICMPNHQKYELTNNHSCSEGNDHPALWSFFFPSQLQKLYFLKSFRLYCLKHKESWYNGPSPNLLCL